MGWGISDDNRVSNFSGYVLKNRTTYGWIYVNSVKKNKVTVKELVDLNNRTEL